MGFLDFLFKPKVELPKQEPDYVEKQYCHSDNHKAGNYPSSMKIKFEDNWYQSGVDPLPRQYSDKGISRSASKKNPYRATLTINTKNKKSEPIYHSVHIGVFATKEEAQKARWEFIENLK